MINAKEPTINGVPPSYYDTASLELLENAADDLNFNAQLFWRKIFSCITNTGSRVPGANIDSGQNQVDTLRHMLKTILLPAIGASSSTLAPTIADGIFPSLGYIVPAAPDNY